MTRRSCVTDNTPFSGPQTSSIHLLLSDEEHAYASAGAAPPFKSALQRELAHLRKSEHITTEMPFLRYKGSAVGVAATGRFSNLGQPSRLRSKSSSTSAFSCCRQLKVRAVENRCSAGRGFLCAPALCRFGPWQTGSCLINSPKPETPRMRPAIKAGLRSHAEAEKAYMRQLGSVEIPTRVVILSGVWRVLGAKRSRRTCGFSAKFDNIPCDKSRPVEGREHVNKARQLLGWDTLYR